MNITTIKKSGITNLTIKKTAQVLLGGIYNTGFLANQPKSNFDQSPYFYSTYPPATDPNLILPVGTTLQILAIHPSNTHGTCHPHLEVLSSTGLTFFIYSTDINRFCQ